MKKLLVAALAAAALAVPTAAHAQLSLGLRVGYAQATGDLEKNDLVANQVPVQLDLDYRLFLGLTIGVYGSYGASGVNGVEAGCSATGVDCTGRIIRAGVQATFTLPVPLVKPWIGAGVGYEWARIARSSGKALTASGMEAFNGQVGVDLSLGYFRIGPFLTYTLSKYDASTLSDGTVGTADLDAAKSGFVYYGLRVRLDP